jgi:23S rRNA (uracil1939-C5)-methyltransferase
MFGLYGYRMSERKKTGPGRNRNSAAGRVSGRANAARHRASERDTPRPAEAVVTIEKIVPGGDGMARLSGKVAFVPFTLPGESVRIRVVRDRKDFLIAEPTEILAPSADRREPPCPLFTRCGGCSLQHMSYEAQREAKREIVRDAFARVGRLELPAPEIVSADELYYRNRIQFHRTADGRLGFMRRDSNAVITVKRCFIAADPINRLFADQTPGAPGRFTAFGFGDRLWVQSDGPGRSGDQDEAGGAETVGIELLGKQFEFGVRGFFQSNIGMLEKLVPDLVEAACRVRRGDGTVVDLYAGTGVFGSFLAERFSRVVSVEHNRYSIASARVNIHGSGHLFFAEDADRWVSGPSAVRVPDLVVVDPPRSGLSAAVRTYLTGSGVSALAYVSCDPVTLARDAAFLASSGFTLEGLTLYDFYPQTPHIESLAVFVRR